MDLTIPTLKFLKLSENGIEPTKSSFKGTQIDLFSAFDYIIEPGKKGLIKTDIQIQLPKNSFALFRPWTSFEFVNLRTCVLFEDSCQVILQVLFFNFGKIPFVIKAGDKVAVLRRQSLNKN